MRRVSASITTALIPQTSDALTRASTRPMIVGVSPAAAVTTSSTDRARAIADRSPTLLRVVAAMTSTSSSTPSSSPVGATTGACRNPRSSMSSNTSPPSRSAAAVQAGAVIALLTGSAVSMPAATTARRSRSVRMPSCPSGSGTTTDVAPHAVMRCAASRTERCGAAVHSGARSRSRTGRWAKSGPASERPGASRVGASSVRAT